MKRTIEIQRVHNDVVEEWATYTVEGSVDVTVFDNVIGVKAEELGLTLPAKDFIVIVKKDG